MSDKNTPTTDRLLGFDSRLLQQEMTKGLADWHRRRREAARSRRLVGLTSCLTLAMVSCVYQMTPTTDYRLDGAMSYEWVVEVNNTMLGR